MIATVFARTNPCSNDVPSSFSSSIEIVSLKGGFKGVTGGDRRGNAGHRCEAYRTGDQPETQNLGLHLVARIARSVTRFEDSLLGAAFGVALLFGLLIAALSVGGW